MKYALEIDNLVKVYNTFKDKKVALQGINLKIKTGDFFGLLGPNGAGKSTLINILGTIVNKTSGKVKVLGYDLDEDPVNMKRSLGIVSQEPNVDPFFTPLGVLINQQGYYGQKPDKNYCLEVLDFMEIKDKANSYIRSLSGGMLRRLLIAKAMVHNPKVLILDEPTAGVDVYLRKRVWEGMEEVNKKGTTIILTTHYLEEAEALCKEIAIINHGKIITQSPTKELLSNLGTKQLVINLKDAKDKAMPESLDDYLVNKDEKGNFYFSYKHDEDSGKIIESLKGSGFIINSLKTEEATLEQVFLRLVK